MHVLNVILSHIAGFESPINDPCVWYFLNVLLDTTVGLLTLFILLRIWLLFVTCAKWTRCETGNYGEPPSVLSWILQLISFLIIIVINKFILILMLKIPFLADFASFLMNPIAQISRHFELIFVMIIFPTTMNIFQFWITDHFLKVDHKFVSIEVSDEESSSFSSTDTFISAQEEINKD